VGYLARRSVPGSPFGLPVIRTRFNPAVSKRGIVAKRRQHIGSLCDRHGITFEYLPPGVSGGRANPKDRTVLIPETTMVRSYYVALHEIAHCVLGFDSAEPRAPQETGAWRWAIDQAIEPPTAGLKRYIFKVLWHYLLSDLVRPESDLSNAERWPPADDSFWAFLAGLDDPSRLLYEATKVTGHVGLLADLRTNAARALDRERQRTKDALRRAHIAEQSLAYGPPSPARTGQLALLGASKKAHVWASDGQFGTFADRGILCGSRGVARPAPPDAPRCKVCLSLEAHL
jgi:hypothetical protein